ncbi:MAG: hypothetical protein M3525_01470 [Acidobacteriota bacterium]|nr:hypothetical protein [Acidobacteriota bacterium]
MNCKRIYKDISQWLRKFTAEQSNVEFESKLTEYLNKYNNKYFPSPEFKIRSRSKDFDDRCYTAEHEAVVLKKYNEVVGLYGIKLKQAKSERFLDKWFVESVREEIDFVAEQIKRVES